MTEPATAPPATTSSSMTGPDTISSIPCPVLSARLRHYGPNTALHFAAQPLHMVRGQGQYLYDAHANRYLDCCNNVAHVGHCHPEVRGVMR